MNKVKLSILLFCSIIGTENTRLEQLALDKCNSIDLTSDYIPPSYELFIERFYLHVMPRINNNIQSLILNIQHMQCIITFANENCNGTLPNLTHLRIMIEKKCSETGSPFSLGNNIYSVLRLQPLSSTIPQLFRFNDSFTRQIFSTFRRSALMRSIISFEIDDDCVLPDAPDDDGLFFPESTFRLTHVRLTLRHFDDCVRLLKQLGTQLYSFSVSLVYTRLGEIDVKSELPLISCPNLKELRLTGYRNIFHYEECIVPLLQRLSNVEHLTLLLAIGVCGDGPDHFIDGTDLYKDIVSYMPHLREFKFDIRSILKDAPHIEVDALRQSFVKLEQFVDCVLDYFNNRYGQCHIFSIPFIGTRLDFISNRFPLFNTNNTFANVTLLFLFDDVKPFESVFFEHVARALPYLRTLEVFNRIEQQEKTTMIANALEFTHLTTLMLQDINIDYAEQLLCRTRLPHLVELVIYYDSLLTIASQDRQQARDNCSKVETLRTIVPWSGHADAVRNLFPLVSFLKSSEMNDIK